MFTLIYFFLSASIIYTLFFMFPKIIKRESAPALQPSPLQSAIVLEHVKDYDDELIDIAQSTKCIRTHKDCQITLRRIEIFSEKYKPLYGFYLVQIDVNMLIELVEKRLLKINRYPVMQF